MQEVKPEPTEIEMQPKPEMPKSHKALAYVLAGVFALAIIAGIYYWQTTSNIPATVDLPVHKSQNSLSDLKTFSDSQFGFEITYPGSWNFKSDLSYADKGFFITNNSGSSIAILPNGGFDYGLPFTDPVVTKTTIEGEAATRREWNLTVSDKLILIQFTEPIENWSQCKSDLKNCNRIDIHSKNADDQAVLDQILSTFKFIDSIDTSTWKTYKDNQVTFRYPPNWEVRDNSPFLSVVDLSIVESSGSIQPDGVSVSTDNGYDSIRDWRLVNSPIFNYTSSRGDDYIEFQMNKITVYASCAFYSHRQPSLDNCNQILSTFKFNETFAVFDLMKAKVGDKVGAMTIVSIQPFNTDAGPVSLNNARILFRGQVTITADYSPPSNDGLLSELGYVGNLDANSLSYMPVANERAAHFAFRNLEFATSKLGLESKRVTMTIDDYEIKIYPTAVLNSATFVK